MKFTTANTNQKKNTKQITNPISKSFKQMNLDPIMQDIMCEPEINYGTNQTWIDHILYSK